MPHYTIRPATEADEGFLWTMLSFAAQMEQESEGGSALARADPFLRAYVEEWGRPGDAGLIAMEPATRDLVGAVWARVLPGGAHRLASVDPSTPELAIAVLPAYRGQGIGAQLLTAFLRSAPRHSPAVALSVRADNPARRLYERLGFVVVGEIVNRIGTRSFTMLRRFD